MKLLSPCLTPPCQWSRPARGAWVEILFRIMGTKRINNSRAPQGARGLKCEKGGTTAPLSFPSRPARGAWVEISSNALRRCTSPSRPARGAWVEMKMPSLSLTFLSGRAPQGARGLKCQTWDRSGPRPPPSRPARGAWVEIAFGRAIVPTKTSRPARGAWVEIFHSANRRRDRGSRPARGAWVEIRCTAVKANHEIVAPRKGRVG